MKRRDFLKKVTALTPFALLPVSLSWIQSEESVGGLKTLASNELIKGNSLIEVDDRTVGIRFGVTSYEEFKPFTGPFERIGKPGYEDIDSDHEWIENHPEEFKRQYWESIRKCIQDEIMGVTRPFCTRNGQVIPPMAPASDEERMAWAEYLAKYNMRYIRTCR